MNIKLPLNWKILGAFGSAIVILLALGTYAFRSVGQSTDSVRSVIHTRDVLANIRLTSLSTERITSGVRGFALTGKETYFDEYQAALVAMWRHVAALRELTADNASQQRRLTAFEELTAKRA